MSGTQLEKSKLACHQESMQALQTARNSGLVQLGLRVNESTHEHDVEQQKSRPIRYNTGLKKKINKKKLYENNPHKMNTP